MQVKKLKRATWIKLEGKELGYLKVILQRYNTGRGAITFDHGGDKSNGFPVELLQELER